MFEGKVAQSRRFFFNCCLPECYTTEVDKFMRVWTYFNQHFKDFFYRIL